MSASVKLARSMAPFLFVLGCGVVPERSEAIGAERSHASGAPHAAEETAEASHEITFERSPGGAYEVTSDWLAVNRASVRVIDIREAIELRDDGHLSHVEWVRLADLATTATTWDREEPIVLVCRSGRRSARGAELLDELGFRHVASLTGGMRAWVAEGHEVVRDGSFRALTSPRHPVTTVEGDDAFEVHWVRVASLLIGGSQACVDGRDEHPVLGTPGGDAGELVLALATAESLTGRALATREVEALLHDYVRAFGRFYFHTDDESMERLRASLAADPRFDEALRGRSVEALVRHPPAELEDALVEALVRPEHVGCGHLRSMLQRPDAYQARAELVEAVLSAAYRRLFRHPEDVDFVVLEGRHREGEVLVVRLEGEVHPYSRVPAIAPRRGDVSRFVLHPQVSAFVREQNAYLLLEDSRTFRDAGLRADTFVARLAELAETQGQATLDILAHDLPRSEIVFRGRELVPR